MATNVSGKRPSKIDFYFYEVTDGATATLHVFPPVKVFKYKATARIVFKNLGDADRSFEFCQVAPAKAGGVAPAGKAHKKGGIASLKHSELGKGVFKGRHWTSVDAQSDPDGEPIIIIDPSA